MNRRDQWPKENLDAMDADDLLRYAAGLMKFPPTTPEDQDAWMRLHCYATAKAHAMLLRESGRIGQALSMEDLANRQYAKMPDDLKW